MAATILAFRAPRAHVPARFLALLLAGALLAACGGDEPAADGDAAAAASAMAVTTVRAQTREVARTITVSGPVAAVEEMQLGVELSGQRVTSLDVDVGERVRRGQVLLTLDHRLLDADLAQANAALREAEASAALARSNLARAERLAQGQFVSASQVDELRAARTQADARVGTARASRDAVALRRSFAELRAPADGIISRRLVQPGQVVAAGSELLRLIKDGRLEWRAELAAEQLAAVSPSDVIALTARDGTTVDGRVRAVTPGVDSATRTGTVYADLPQPGALQPGTYLEGRISTGRGPATVLPAAAVVLRDGFATVFTVEANNTVKQRRIVAGSRDGDQVVVASGLPAGARVVVDGAGFLADGDAVRVVEATAATPARPAADAAPAR